MREIASGPTWLPDVRFEFDRSPILSLGAARSGKSTLARLAASFPHVDHLDEPWPLLALSMAVLTEQVSEDSAVGPLRCMVAELHNDAALLRTANFRPSDGSSIWKTKRIGEIGQRLLRLKGRGEASDFSRANNLNLWLTCTELNGAHEFLRAAFPTRTVVLTLRHPLEVATEICTKGWYSDVNLSQPPLNTPTWPVHSRRLDRTIFVPWWVAEEERERWVDADEPTRALIYWRLMHQGLDLDAGQIPNGTTLFTFREITRSTTVVVEGLSGLLGKEPTRRTARIARETAPWTLPTLEMSESASSEMELLQPMVDAFDL